MIPRYSRPEMTALWTDDARLVRWLQVECAHLRALEQLGQAQPGIADLVQRTAVLRPERAAEIEAVVKHDVIAFLTMVEESVGDNARLLHRGLTSSDVLDTSLALLLRDAGHILQAALKKVIVALAERSREHRHTFTIGRSHGMHAEPTTFGLVLAGHLAEFVRCWNRLAAGIAEISVGTLSGAVGTYAQTPPEAESIALASLGLRAETVPTQVVPRDPHEPLLERELLLQFLLQPADREMRADARERLLQRRLERVCLAQRLQPLRPAVGTRRQHCRKCLCRVFGGHKARLQRVTLPCAEVQPKEPPHCRGPVHAVDRPRERAKHPL